MRDRRGSWKAHWNGKTSGESGTLAAKYFFADVEVGGWIVGPTSITLEAD
jgi:hypothetical protein